MNLTAVFMKEGMIKLCVVCCNNGSRHVHWNQSPEIWSADGQELHPQALNQSHSAPGWSISTTLVAAFPLASWVKKNKSSMFSDAADVSKSSSRRLLCYLN